MKNLLYVAPMLLTVAALENAAQAQSVSLGADIVSRYVWRGTDFGESASIQPTLAVSGGGLEIGTWASYSVSANGASANEHDIWIGYSLDLGSGGSLTIGVTDYYFPSPGGGDFDNFEGDGEGSHWLEPYVSYSAAGNFPISVFAGIMAHNDPDNSLYVEVGLPLDVGGTELGLSLATVAGKSDFYAVESTSIVGLGASASKDLTFVEGGFSLPVSVAYILNPTASRSFLVFGLNISL